MRLIINASNSVAGGSLQVVNSFLCELKQVSIHKYFVFLSTAVADQLDFNEFPDNFTFYCFKSSPAKLLSRRKIVGLMRKLEAEIKPDVVFTIFGPSYWRPHTIHVMGFALGWAISPHTVAYSKLSILEALRMKLLTIYWKYYVLRDGDFLIVETDEVKKKLVEYKWKSEGNIFVVSNTYHKYFDGIYDKFKFPFKVDVFKLVTISASYPHKNLDVIRNVIPYLKTRGLKCHFYLTLSETEFNSNFDHLSDWVTNLGPVPIKFCPSIYEQCDALFLPTLLESFSASYPEAMKMKIPILTSNFEFARTICGEAAEYFNPLDPIDIAEKISRIVTDEQRRIDLVRFGTERLQLFPTPSKKARMYLDILNRVNNLYV